MNIQQSQTTGLAYTQYAQRFQARLRRLAATGLAAVLAVSMCVPLASAHAEVRKADEVVGQSVGDRDLSVSECPSITAERAALISQDGTVYFTRKGTDKAQIASITKVMTAIVALDQASEDLTVTVSAAAAEIGESSAGLQEGDTMDLKTALKALLVPSGNDAAVAIAEAVGAKMGGTSTTSVDTFVDAMNEKARELNLSDTKYENPHGLDDGEFAGDLHSTAEDQAIVAKCAMSYPTIREIVGGGSTTIEVRRQAARESIELETTDLLLDMYSYAIGVKTGVTNLAGPSFMGAANKEGREMYAVVLGCNDEYARFEDAKALFEWGFDHIIDLPLANSDQWTAMRKDGSNDQVPVIAAASHYEWVDRTVPATLADPDAQIKVFDLEGNVSQDVSFEEIHGTVNVGDKVGKITFYQNNKEVASQDLVACERVEAPNPIDTVAIWWQRTTQGLDDKTGRAQSKVYNVMPVINNSKSSAP